MLWIRGHYMPEACPYPGYRFPLWRGGPGSRFHAIDIIEAIEALFVMCVWSIEHLSEDGLIFICGDSWGKIGGNWEKCIIFVACMQTFDDPLTN